MKLPNLIHISSFIPRPRLIRVFLSISISAVLVIVSLILVGVNAHASAKGRANYFVSSAAVYDNATVDYLDITAFVNSIDVPNQFMKVTYMFQLGGDLLGRAKGIFHQTKYDLNFASTTQKFSFPSGSLLIPQTGTILIDGDFNQYPFDSFAGYFLVQGTYNYKSSSSSGNETLLPLPIRLTLSGIPNGFNVEYVVLDTTTTETQEQQQHTEVLGLANISRSDSVKSFAMLITITMWALGVASAVYTASIYLFDKRPEPPTVGFHVALLFALPSMRNSMPVAPPIGSLVDQMCLVWVMMVLAICVLLQFVKQTKRDEEVGNSQNVSPPGQSCAGSVAFISPNNTSFLTAMS
ncbi:hypothetical protein BDR26DRAFT_930795 [Obelidium mucronatum]|nr:hypothetical protein BDR26DRAFT_930795 [Obelidium mucronatum]